MRKKTGYPLSSVSGTIRRNAHWLLHLTDLDTSAIINLPDMQACHKRIRRGCWQMQVRDLREVVNDELWRVAA